jgi:hypothetical protein
MFVHGLLCVREGGGYNLASVTTVGQHTQARYLNMCQATELPLAITARTCFVDVVPAHSIWLIVRLQ